MIINDVVNPDSDNTEGIMMSFFYDTKYDYCKTWIKKKRDKGFTWDDLKLACKSNDKDLECFLNSHIDDDDWPEDLTASSWKQLVKELEEIDNNRIHIQDASLMATLVSKSENSEVFIPEDERSSWQLYKKHLLQDYHFTDDAVDKIEQASIDTLKNLSRSTVKTDPIKGLVIGSVQSGKTANMAGLMAMAADWHWNMFIILSGTIETLRQQTQKRLYKDLNNEGNLVWTSLDHLSKKRSPYGQRTCDLHFEDNCNIRYMTVCLKVSSRLKDLIEWIEDDHQNIRNMKVLVIDDEADQAGINTRDVYQKDEQSTINRLILNLIYCRNKKATNFDNNTYDSQYQAMNYICYTATPYANCLNSIGDNTLYPSNFIKTLASSHSYIGPSRLFGVQDADRDSCLDIIREIPEDDFNTIKEIESSGTGQIPKSLQNAVLWFICVAAAVRVHGYKKPVSMLVHTSQKQENHAEIADSIKKWIFSKQEDIPELCKEIYIEETGRLTKESFIKTYPEYEQPIDSIWDYPDFGELIPEIKDLITDISPILMDEEGELQYKRNIHLCIDNCAMNKSDDGMHMRLAYPDDEKNAELGFSTAFIVIGGNTLSRGLTLEGLVSTFFLRSVKQADTLMQMGRWFGYRIHYEMFPRVWMTEDTQSKFDLLNEIDIDLRSQIYQMQVQGKTPADFSLTLETSPKISWMRLTAKNKMQSAVPADMDFSGSDTQLTVYSKDASILHKNIITAENFITLLGKSYRKSENTEAYIWQDISFSTIVDEFFSKGFEICETSRSFQQIDLLKEWVDRQTSERKLQSWNVIVSGTKIDSEMQDEMKWNLHNGIITGKINRSCKTDSGNRINIGVLSGKKDYVADITENMLGADKWNALVTCKSISNEYKEYRRLAKVDKIPLFLIYLINKNSKAQSSNRTSLHMPDDMVGITMVIPGTCGENASRLKIKMLEDTSEEVDNAD